MTEVTVFREPQLQRFQLAYFGRDADEHRLDMYDASTSYYGFARTVYILGHYYATGQINAHAPKSAIDLYLESPEEGSYKQTIMAAVLSAVITAPLTVFITRVLDNRIPDEDPQTQQIIELLEEQNRVLKKQMESDTLSDEIKEKQIDEVDGHIESNKDRIDVMRSITSNSFRNIFRPVGRSVEYVSLTAGKTNQPIGAVNERSLRLIEADRLDEEVVTIVGIVNSFSRRSKSGVMFSKDIGRGFRFEYVHKGTLRVEDPFSWSQYYQREIAVTGRFVRFFDGKIKKMVIYHVERIEREQA